MTKETQQLKKWQTMFGKSYTRRNTFSLNDLQKLYKKDYGVTWTALTGQFTGGIPKDARILEVGCNIGNQLSALQKIGFKNLYGIEPQEYAVDHARKKLKGITVIRGNALDIPFKDGYFDLVFTSGVLIHINPKDIKTAMKEIYRCSRKYIWGFEYYAEKYQEVLYRGEKNLLWKGDFPGIYTGLFPDLKAVKTRLLKYLHNDNVDVMFLLKK
jgi:pseudaminic acid biosynthesis-associated methylase